jgi:hypothetical protein
MEEGSETSTSDVVLAEIFAFSRSFFVLSEA